MNSRNNTSLARRLAIRLSVLLAATFILLLGGAYLSNNRIIKDRGEKYTKALLTVYADLIMFESDNLNRPIDISFNDRYTFFGEYMCLWYSIDCIYAYVPDFENGTITFLSSVKNKKKYGDAAEGNMVGRTIDHIMTESEINAWNDSTIFAVGGSKLSENSTGLMLGIYDKFGNKAMVGADIAVDELRQDVTRGFLVAAAFLLIIIVLFAGLLYRFIKRMVSEPARRISQTMTDYISAGKRSTIKLRSDGNDEFSMIAESFNNMTEDIDLYINDIARMGREHERQQAEIDIAAEIQKGILSSGNASLQNCSIRAVMKPAKYIGGDLYDYIELDDAHTLAVIGDVSGKGTSSAILMAVAITLIRQYARMGLGPAGILKNVNDTLSEENPQLMFITAFVAIYNSENGILTYANAGHNPAYHIHDRVEILEGSEGTPLGLFPGEEYTDVELKMDDGDSLFLYTDGVNEAVNEVGEFFGTERLEKVLGETISSTKKFFVESVEASINAFVNETEQNDDITMLNLCVRKKPVLELGYDIREFSKIRDLLFSSSLKKDLIMDLCVAAEECFVNICSYAFDGPVPEGEKILFYFEYSNKVKMRFSDGGRRFDPRNDLPDADEYNIDSAVGGLGRLIAFTVADSVDYEYKDGRNILTITKSIKI